MSALSTKLEKLEQALAPPPKFFSVTQTEIISSSGPSKPLPISEGKMARVKAEGYREGVDVLVVVREFVCEDDQDVVGLGLAPDPATAYAASAKLRDADQIVVAQAAEELPPNRT